MSFIYPCKYTLRTCLLCIGECTLFSSKSKCVIWFGEYIMYYSESKYLLYIVKYTQYLNKSTCVLGRVEKYKKALT